MAKPVAWTYVWKGEGISFKERQGLREGKACVEGVTLIVGRDDTHFVWSSDTSVLLVSRRWNVVPMVLQ